MRYRSFLCDSNDWSFCLIPARFWTAIKASKCISADWTKMAPNNTYQVILTPPDNKNTWKTDNCYVLSMTRLHFLFWNNLAQ